MTDEEAGRVRDFVGYGRNPPDPKWPGGAHVAVNFVINYEEGGEISVPDGAPASETGLTEGALYLLRPDTYIALVDAGGSPGELERYFTDHELRP